MHSLRLKQFANAYRDAFDRHRRRPSEATLRSAYELGREAIAHELSVLDVAEIHHQALITALGTDPLQDGAATTRSAADFFQEVLSAAEMVRRGYREAHDARLEARRGAAVIQRMSTLLSDPSLAAARDDTIGEVLQLVAEHARELAEADQVIARLERPFPRSARTPASDSSGTTSDGAALSVPLLALDGSALGSLELRRSRGRFSSSERAAVAHLAEMTAAAIDRALLYRA
jgi:GAF domain-containing protein